MTKNNLMKCLKFLFLGFIAIVGYEYLKLIYHLNYSFYKEPFFLIFLFASLSIGALYFIRNNYCSFAIKFQGLVVFCVLIVVSFLSDNAFSLFLFIWIILISLCLGNSFLNFLFKDEIYSISSLELTIFSIGIGLGFISLVMFFLGIAGFFYKKIVISLLIVFTFVFYKKFIFMAKKFINLFNRKNNEEINFFSYYFIFLLILFAFVSFLGAIAPEVFYDSVAYHLTVPKLFIEEGRIIDLPHIFMSHSAKSIEMLFAIGLILSDQIGAKLFPWGFGLLTVLGMVSFGKRFFSLESGIIAAAIFYVTPIVFWLSSTAYVELPVAFYSLVAFYAFCLWWEKGKREFLILSGIFSGMAIAVKLNSLLLLFPIGICIITCFIFKKRNSIKENIGDISIYIGMILLFSVPWHVLPFVYTGNPVFPFLNSIFKSPLVSATSSTITPDLGMGRGFFDLIALPFNLSINTHQFAREWPKGSAGLIFLLGFPGVFFFFSKTSGVLRLLIAVSSCFILLWFYIGQNLRYFLPCFPLVGLLASFVIFYFLKAFRGFNAKIFQISIFTLLLLLPLNLLSYLSVNDKLPLGLAFGLESKEAYLENKLGDYYVSLKYLNSMDNPEYKKGFLVGLPYLFYSKIHLESYISSLNTRNYKNLIMEEFIKNLKKEKYTHLFYDEKATFKNNEFLYLRKKEVLEDNFESIFTSGRITIYKIN